MQYPFNQCVLIVYCLTIVVVIFTFHSVGETKQYTQRVVVHYEKIWHANAFTTLELVTSEENFGWHLSRREKQHQHRFPIFQVVLTNRLCQRKNTCALCKGQHLEEKKP